MAVSAGTAALQVVPTLTRDFSRQLATQLAGPAVRTADKTGQQAGRRFGTRFSVGARAGLGPVTGMVRGFGGALAGAFAGVAVISGLKATITAASDLQETLNKNKVVFGRSAASIELWSRTSAKSFGLSQNAALGAAAQFGEMFSQLGFTEKQAAKTSKSIVQTAADLGSFHNVDPSDVLERISAALRGEYDSLQQLIPNINAARVEQEALRMTHKDSIKDVTAAEKATAVLAIVQRDGANAAGDFAKTSDNAANRQRILTATMEDQKAAIGKSLLPAWNSILGFLIKNVVPGLSRVADWLSVKIPQAMDVLSEALKAGRDWWNKNKDSVKALADVLSMFYTPAVESATGKTKTMNFTAEQLLGMIKTLMGVVLRAVQVWLFFEKGVIQIYDALASVIIAAGHTVNVLDRLSGGTGHAGDAMVAFGKDLKNQARAELKAVEEQSKATQRAIDKLHGKNIAITGTTSLHFTKTFTQKDWMNARLAAGRQATGGPVGRHPRNVGVAGGRDTELRWLDPTEHVWTGREVAAAGGHAAMERWRGAVLAGNVPGMATGGAVGVRNTDQAHTGVGKMMDKWGTVRLAALVKELVSGGGPGIRRALSWARGQEGKPYIWGGVGPRGYDCSGFMSAIANVIAGRGPHRRLFATGTFPASGWVPGFSPQGFSVGSFRGSPGHMAGTLGGVNVESRGSRGVVVGGGARGARDGLFGGNIWHLTGRSGGAGGAERWAGFDAGGWLQPGMTMAVNNTGQPERVIGPQERIPTADEIARVLARELRRHPPVVRFADVRAAGLVYKNDRGGRPIGLG